MTRRPAVVVEKRKLRSPATAAERLRRVEIGKRAHAIIAALAADLAGADEEFRFEVQRAVIRRLATLMALDTDAARTLGVLGGGRRGP